MSIQNPWEVSHIEGAVSFAAYLSGATKTGSAIRTTPAFFQRGIEWSDEHVADTLADIFPNHLHAALLDSGHAALADARIQSQALTQTDDDTTLDNANAHNSATGLEKLFFHGIDLQAQSTNKESLVDIIDGQQRTTFWRCMAMTLIDLMITDRAPIVPQALVATLWNNGRTMTFGENSVYDRLSKPFCVNLAFHWFNVNGRDHLHAVYQDIIDTITTQNSGDPVLRLHRETRVRLTHIVDLIAQADRAQTKPLAENRLAALYAVARRILFDCDVCITVLPPHISGGRYFQTKNARGAHLSEHALITSALHEYTPPSGLITISSSDAVKKWRRLTNMVLAHAGGTLRMATAAAQNMICHAATLALLGSHTRILREHPPQLNDLITCQRKSGGNAFKVIDWLMKNSTFDVQKFLDVLEQHLPDFLTLYGARDGDHTSILEPGLLNMFRLSNKGAGAHAVMVARVFNNPAREIVALAQALTAMTTINATYELAAEQGIVTKTGRVGASLNHAIGSSVRTVLETANKTATPNPGAFAQTLLAELTSEKGNSPYYTRERHHEAVDKLPLIVFNKNTDHLRALMHAKWYAREGKTAVLNRKVVEIEHILPVSPSPKAVQESRISISGPNAKDDDGWKKIIGLIGNREWLPANINNIISNDCFSAKKAYLKAQQGVGSSIQSIARMKQFTAVEVEQRGKQAAIIINGLWVSWIPAAIVQTSRSKKTHTRPRIVAA